MHSHRHTDTSGAGGSRVRDRGREMNCADESIFLLIAMFTLMIQYLRLFSVNVYICAKWYAVICECFGLGCMINKKVYFMEIKSLKHAQKGYFKLKVT